MNEMYKRIKALVEKYNVPSRLTPDWEWTRHFELTDEHGRLWLDVEDALVLLPDGQVALSDEAEKVTVVDHYREAGGRLGFCLEAAALVAEMAGVLDTEEGKNIDELAAEQGVKPMDDVRKLFGTWPGEQDDGFGEKEEVRREIER